MYVTGNPKTKKQLKEWIAEGKRVTCFSPGPFPCPTEGRISLKVPGLPQFRTGRIIVQTREEPAKPEPQTAEERAAKALLEVEAYLNSEAALTIFRKFGVLIRVHL